MRAYDAATHGVEHILLLNPMGLLEPNSYGQVHDRTASGRRVQCPACAAMLMITCASSSSEK